METSQHTRPTLVITVLSLITHHIKSSHTPQLTLAFPSHTRTHSNTPPLTPLHTYLETCALWCSANKRSWFNICLVSMFYYCYLFVYDSSMFLYPWKDMNVFLSNGQMRVLISSPFSLFLLIFCLSFLFPWSNFFLCSFSCFFLFFFLLTFYFNVMIKYLR